MQMILEWDLNADHFRVNDGRDCNCGCPLLEGFERHLADVTSIGGKLD